MTTAAGLSIRVRGVALAIAAAAILSPTPSGAQTTANLNVSANVVSSCSVAAGTLAFGAYDPASAGALDATGSFSLTCTQGTVATVALDNGAHASGATRRMINGSSFLTYLLFKDPARTQTWGSSGGDFLTLAAAPSIAARSVNVYGRVAGAQDVAFGSYSDTVVITVTF